MTQPFRHPDRGSAGSRSPAPAPAADPVVTTPAGTDATVGPLNDDDGPDGPHPPRREQLPLPRRDEQTHLEPRLREPVGAGTGTPFAASGPDPGTGGDPTTPTGERAATFREATRRAADDRSPDARLPADQLPNGPASR